MPRLDLREIASVGLELEGAYCEKCLDTIERTMPHFRLLQEFERDCDCSVSDPYECPKHTDDYDSSMCSDGELRVWTTVRNLPVLFDFVKRLWKSGGFHQNHTCGNHVHLRFKHQSRYNTFAQRTTWDDFIKAYRKAYKLDKYIARLSSSWCTSRWTSDIPEDHGYSDGMMINLASIDYNDTMEIRILPHFANEREAVTSYLKMLNIVDRIALRGA